VKGPQMQIFGGVTQLPWAMKPMIGLFSDAFPIYGFNKAPYIVAASVMGVLACGFMGFVPGHYFGVEVLVMCFFLVQLQMSTCDLLTEAKYAEKMQSKPKYGPDLMTYVWFGMNATSLLATITVGPLMEHWGYKAPLILALPALASILLPTTQNCLEETPQDKEAVAERRAQLFEQKEACGLCVLMFVGTVFLTVMAIMFEDIKLNAACAISVAVIMLIAFSLVLKPVIAKVNAFFLIQTSLGVSIGGASFYFYTDSPEEYPEGPHFSMEFFTSALGVVGGVCSLIGIYTYQQYMREWTYRRMLLVTNLVLSVLSICDVMMFTRMNLRLGLPDHAFVLGASVAQTVVAQWMWMPGVVILSQLCPKGMEATMYALLAGCHNLGNTIAANTGALLLEALKINPSGDKGESHQFDNLWIASCISTVMPLMTLIALPYLIPPHKQTDKILSDDDRDATEGSLWRRWFG